MYERLSDIDQVVNQAVHAVERDISASPIVDAVLRELQRKSIRALSLADEDATTEEIHDAVVELEQAGDSARAAAEADPGLRNETLAAVLDAHKAIAIFKTDLDFS